MHTHHITAGAVCEQEVAQVRELRAHSVHRLVHQQQLEKAEEVLAMIVWANTHFTLQSRDLPRLADHIGLATVYCVLQIIQIAKKVAAEDSGEPTAARLQVLNVDLLLKSRTMDDPIHPVFLEQIVVLRLRMKSYPHLKHGHRDDILLQAAQVHDHVVHLFLRPVDPL